MATKKATKKTTRKKKAISNFEKCVTPRVAPKITGKGSRGSSAITGTTKVPMSVIATPTFEEKFLEEHKRKSNNLKLKGAKREDINYLLGLLKELYDLYDGQLKDEMPVIEQTETDFTKSVTRRYTPKQMFDNGIRYFQITLVYEQPITLVGLSMFMGFSRVQLASFLNNPNMHEAYSFLKDFVSFCEMFNEYAAHKKQNPAGAIFILKNFGWSDRIDMNVNATSTGEMSYDERKEAQKRIDNFTE